MAMNKEETKIVERIKKYLNVKAPMGISCNVCQHRNWEIIPKISEISEFHSRSAMGAPFRIPIIPVMCVNCSNTLFFNAIRLKLVPPDKEEGDHK